VTQNKKRRLSSKSKTQSESSSPKGVVRKLLKPQRPRRQKSRDSRKMVVKSRDEDTVSATTQDAGSPVVGQESKTRIAVGSVSSATKLKLAAFSATDVVRCCC